MHRGFETICRGDGRRILGVLLGIYLMVTGAYAQEANPLNEEGEQPESAVTAADSNSAGYVIFNFPEPIDVRELVDYVSRQTGTKFLYDDTFSGKVMLRSPGQVPINSLPDLLASILRFKGYAIIERDGWNQIMKIQRLPSEAPITAEGQLPDDEVPVTIVIALKEVDANKALNTIKPLLSQPGGNAFAVVDMNALILTDFSSNLDRVAKLIGMLDVERPTVQLQSFEVGKTLPSRIAPVLKQIVAAIEQAREKAGGSPSLIQPWIMESDRTGELLVVASQEMIETIRPVIGRLDSASSRVLRTYRIENLDAAKAIETLEKVFSGMDEAFKATFVNLTASNTIIVAASPEAQEAVVQTLQILDVPRDQPGELQFYKIVNMPADNLKELLAQIYGGDPVAAGVLIVVDPGMNTLICRASKEEQTTLGQLIRRLDQERELSEGSLRFYRLKNIDAQTLAVTLKEVFAQGTVSIVEGAQTQAAISANREGYSSGRIGMDSTSDVTESKPPVAVASLRGQGKTNDSESEIIISVDRNTNALIVNAPFRLHQSVEQIIAELDQRRPQVLVEVKVVSISHTDGFNLGVELETNRLDKRNPVLLFSNFGLSTLDPDTGQRTIDVSGAGFGASIVTANDLDIIIRALQTELRAKALSAPRLLVNDNAEGTLRSVSEEPYTAINTGETVATTSFAGYAEAGTWLWVKPHISNANYIRLKYRINRSGFRGTGTESSPPPRDSEEVESEITIPDGHAVIVGGLNSNRRSKTTSRIPYLGSIPLIGAVFRLFDKSETQSTLYIFIKATILRDDTFEDLRWLSQKHLTESGESTADGMGAIYPPTLPERMPLPAVSLEAQE